jgi:hypothetical protein
MSVGLLLSFTLLFIINLFVVTSIRGIYRFEMMKKYHYDYYYNQPMSIIEKYWHHFRISILKLPTYLFSISLTAVESFILFS